MKDCGASIQLAPVRLSKSKDRHVEILNSINNLIGELDGEANAVRHLLHLGVMSYLNKVTVKDGVSSVKLEQRVKVVKPKTCDDDVFSDFEF